MNTVTSDRAREVMIESIREIAETEENIQILDSQDLNEDLGIDSLMAVDLVIFIERELNIVMPEVEVTKVKTVGDFFTLISTLVGESVAI